MTRQLLITALVCSLVAATALAQWVTPRDWIEGEIVTAGQMNQHVRNNLNFLFDRTQDNGRNAVRQVVVGETSTQVTTAADTFVSTGLEVTVTVAADSRVALDLAQYLDREAGPLTVVEFRLVRDATPLRTIIAAPPDLASGYVSAYLLDTPPAPGAYTYRTEFRVVSGGAVRAQTGGDFSSSMRAMELAPA